MRARRTYMVHLGDQTRSRTDSHGIISFSVGLVRSLPDALTADERLVVVVNDELRPELGSDWGRDHDELRVVPAPTSTIDRLRIDHLTVRRQAARSGAHAVLFPKGFLPLLPTVGASLVCLHDGIPLQQCRDRRLSLRRRARAIYFSVLLDRSLRTADRRLFVSETTAEALTSGATHSGDLVIGEGIPLPRRPLVPIASRARDAIVFGSAHPHKRIEAGLDLLLSVPGLDRHLDRVVVLGDHPPRRRPGAAIDVVHRPGTVDSETLADLIANSRLLVFPSEYEGFGLPPIEALALGTPVVHRRTAAATELLGEIVGGYDRETQRSFDAAVADALALDDVALAEFSATMWARFDWPVVAERVAVALRSATADAQA